MSIKVYTDGGCKPNPGKGGWAFIILMEDKICYKKSGGDSKTTNNIMELTAVYKALKKLPEITKLSIYCDSQYVTDCATGKKKTHKNLELWEKYDKYSADKDITWIKVKSHSGDEYNDMVDKMASKEIEKL